MILVQIPDSTTSDCHFPINLEASAALLEASAVWGSFCGETVELRVFVSSAIDLRSTAPPAFVTDLFRVESPADDFTSGDAVLSGDGL